MPMTGIYRMVQIICCNGKMSIFRSVFEKIAIRLHVVPNLGGGIVIVAEGMRLELSRRSP